MTLKTVHLACSIRCSNRLPEETVSPNTYFAFTPLLTAASVGTIDYNSALEPVRRYPEVVRFLSFPTPSFSGT